jgi:hypothetical protein
MYSDSASTEQYMLQQMCIVTLLALVSTSATTNTATITD